MNDLFSLLYIFYLSSSLAHPPLLPRSPYLSNQPSPLTMVVTHLKNTPTYLLPTYLPPISTTNSIHLNPAFFPTTQPNKHLFQPPNSLHSRNPSREHLHKHILYDIIYSHCPFPRHAFPSLQYMYAMRAPQSATSNQNSHCKPNPQNQYPYVFFRPPFTPRNHTTCICINLF
jgi:hypothetical protein